MPLKSKWFSSNERCRQCAANDAQHILVGAAGLHVFLVQEALILIDGAAIDSTEVNAWHYGPSTAAAVLRYKQTRNIINHSYQQRADNIVGKLTIASLDEAMQFFESGIVLLGGAALRIGAALLASPVVGVTTPRFVVVTEMNPPWARWADQFVAADPLRRSKVPIPNGQTPAIIASAFQRAIALAGNGGTVIISVGHGIFLDGTTDEGRFDLGPSGSFKVGGRNATLVGDPPPRIPVPHPVFHETSVFYADSPPPPFRSRKSDDEGSGSPNARRRLANWAAYDDIAKAFRSVRLTQIVLLTCRVGGATGLIKRVAQQWNNSILGYKRKVAGLDVNGRSRIFLDGDPPGTFYQWPNTTNTPAAETFFPISRDSVQVSP